MITRRYGTGMDNIDTAAARARGVALVSVPDYSLEEVANHTIALMKPGAVLVTAISAG